jgi:hypothetical protein
LADKFLALHAGHQTAFACERPLCRHKRPFHNPSFRELSLGTKTPSTILDMRDAAAHFELSWDLTDATDVLAPAAPRPKLASVLRGAIIPVRGHQQSSPRSPQTKLIGDIHPK